MNPIALASGVLPEHGPLDCVRAADEAGFDMVGFTVDPESWTDATTREVRAALAGTGLGIVDVEVLWLQPGSDFDAHRRILDVGLELGAANALCVASPDDPSETAPWLQQMCDHVKGSAMRVALEFGIFTNVKTLETALDILAQVDSPAKALLIDPIHVDRSGATPADIASVDRALISYAQFCDAPAERPEREDFDAVIVDAIDLREQLGEGALPLAELYRALPAGLPLSIELRSKALRETFPDPVARAKAVADATRRWLREVGKR